MKTMFRYFFLCFFLSFGALWAGSYDYWTVDRDNHHIHVVKVTPGSFEPKLVKAHDGAPGRETVSVLAQRHGATLAINGGFFEIGGETDGAPSRTLVIDGRVYKILPGLQSLMMIRSGNISFQRGNPEKMATDQLSLLTGVPMLVEGGIIPPQLSQEKSTFFTHAHGRTAIGVGKDGVIFLVVAEHFYAMDSNAMTMGDVRSLVKKNAAAYCQKYQKENPRDLTLGELEAIIREEVCPPGRTQGLTILELASFMKDLGCMDALNLDGGGSCALWINGRIVNECIGDVDEGNGIKKERPVSDALVFIAKKDG